MEKVVHQEIKHFTYSTEEERASHLQEMVRDGWDAGGRVKRMKPGTSIWDSDKEENYEWFAEYWRCHL